MAVAKGMGYQAVAIFGNPENYACYGFKNCKRYDVCLEEAVYPVALMVKELEEGALSEKSWKYVESPAYNLDESGFEEYDSTFPQMEKGYKYTQELFYLIQSRIPLPLREGMNAKNMGRTFVRSMIQ